MFGAVEVDWKRRWVRRGCICDCGGGKLAQKMHSAVVWRAWNGGIDDREVAGVRSLWAVVERIERMFVSYVKRDCLKDVWE